MLGPLTLVLTPLLVFLPHVLSGGLIAPNDGYQQYLPLRVVAARIWRSGQIPMWNAYSFSGWALLGGGQTGVFYPPNVLYVALSPALANNASVILHFSFAAVGGALFANRLCGDRVAAAVGGLTFAFSGFFFGHVGLQSMVASAAWLPWAMYGTELVRERVTVARLCVASGALAFSLLAGHFQIFFMVIMALLVYGAGLSVLGVDGTRARPLVVALGVCALGLALGSVQLLPVVALLPFTDRAEISFEFAMTYSFPRSHLPLLLFPHLFGATVPTGPYQTPYMGSWNLLDLSGYPGLASVALAAIGLSAVRRDPRAAVLAGLAGLSILLLAGPATPLSRLVYGLPVYGAFRAWGRYSLLLDLAVSMLASYGLAAIRSSEGRARRRQRRVAIICGVGFVALALLLPNVSWIERFMVGGTERWLALGTPLVFGVAAVAACAVTVRRQHIVVATLCLLTVLDPLASYGLFADWRNGSPSVAQLERDLAGPPMFGPLHDAPGGRDRVALFYTDFRAFNPGRPRELVYENAHAPQVTAMMGVHAINGYDTPAPRHYMDTVGKMANYGAITDAHALYQPAGLILDLLRVSTVVVDASTVPPPPAGSRIEGPPQPTRTLLRYDITPRLRDVFLVGEVIHTSRQQAAESLKGTTAFDPTETVLIEDECRQCSAANGPGPAGVVRWAQWESQFIRVAVSADRPGMLVVSEAWAPGWRATVQRRAAPVLRANGLVLGVPVPEGESTVELAYRAPGLTVGASITLATLVCLLVVGIVRKARSKEPRDTGQ